jgi:hypothetical protein
MGEILGRDVGDPEPAAESTHALRDMERPCRCVSQGRGPS